MTTRPFALQALLKVALAEVDSAAASLGELNRQLQQQEQQLTLLLHYRADYQQRLRSATASGLDCAGLRNFSEFMDRLELAIRQQHALIEEARTRAGQGRDHWQAKRRKSKSFDTLSQRATASAMHEASCREQKAQDDLASRTARQRALAER